MEQHKSFRSIYFFGFDLKSKDFRNTPVYVKSKWSEKSVLIKKACLADFDFIKNNLKNAKKTLVTCLYKFIFESDGDRNNRKKVRLFEGFNFNKATKATQKRRHI